METNEFKTYTEGDLEIAYNAGTTVGGAYAVIGTALTIGFVVCIKKIFDKAIDNSIPYKDNHSIDGIKERVLGKVKAVRKKVQKVYHKCEENN